MAFEHFWESSGAEAGGGGGGDPGDPIGHSLRFRGTQQQLLAFDSFSTTTKADACFSFWMKLGVQTTATTSHALGMICYGAAGGGIDLRMSSGGLFHDGASYPGTQYYRDNSGWYHCFVRYTASTNLQEVYMNGVLQYSKTIAYTQAINGTRFQIGNTTAYPWNYFQYVGYMADYHYVYGQALNPETFGRPNSNGVWVPVTPTNLTYGDNGFHLTFDQTQTNGIGHDSSGEGNHFTATGFDTTAGDPTYDLMEDSPTNNFATLNPIDTGTQALSNANLSVVSANSAKINLSTHVFTSGKWYWEVPDISVVSGQYPGVGVLEAPRASAGVGLTSQDLMWYTGGYVYYGGTYAAYGTADTTSGRTYACAYDADTCTFYLDDQAITGSTPGWVHPNPTTGPRSIGFALNNNLNHVNFGQQPFAYTPPAGFEPLSTANMPASTIANGRDHFQAITGPGQGSVTSTVTDIQTLNQLETHFTADSTLTPQSNADLIGVRVYMSGGSGAGGSAAYLESLGGGPYVYGSNGDDTEWRTRFLSKTELNGSGAFTAGAGGTINSSNTYGGGAGQLSQFVTNGGGITLTAAGSNGGNGRYVPAFSTTFYTSAGGKADAGSMTIVDTTYTAIAGGAGGASRNMPGTNNGSPGNEGQMYSLELYPTSSGIGVSSAVVILTLDNTTGLANINVGNTVENLNGTAEGIVVFIDGSTIYIEQTTGQFSIGDQLLTLSGPGSGLLGLAQQTFPSGLWWIKDRTVTQQHQLVDVMNGTSDVWQTPAATGGHNYAAPTGTAIAWCWQAGSTTVANTDGTINSNVRANPDAGFSIVQWTGTETAGSVGHGLNGTPDFIIGTGYTGSLIPSWNSAATPAAGYNYLNATTTWSTNEDIWNSAQMSATTFGVGTSAITNDSGETMTAYVWTAIPGYSAFGSYTGNANADGPFVYLGFRPAWIMIKQIDGTWSWWIHDTTRNPNNPNTAILWPDNASLEDNNASYAVDFLSNGFKIRTSNPGWNTSGGTYFYATFAENPFQSPVTAR